MAYGIVHQFAGGTKEQYEASLAAVHPSGGGLPQGQIFHAAGASADGWVIVAVHESKESWEQFRDGTLMPKLQEGIAGGFTSRPQRRCSRCTTFSRNQLSTSSTTWAAAQSLPGSSADPALDSAPAGDGSGATTMPRPWPSAASTRQHRSDTGKNASGRGFAVAP